MPRQKGLLIGFPKPGPVEKPKTKDELRKELLSRWYKQARKEGLSEAKIASAAKMLLWWHKLEK